VNDYRYPSMYRSDARLSKVIPITERAKLYLNFEVFNLANTWAATGYTSNRAYQEAKGVITASPQLLYIPSGAACPPTARRPDACRSAAALSSRLSNDMQYYGAGGSAACPIFHSGLSRSVTLPNARSSLYLFSICNSI